MTNKHLDDFEIQQFVLLESPSDIDSSEHIKTCLACQKKAEHYKSLFDQIRIQEHPIFDFDVAELVAAQMPQVQHKVPNGSPFLYIIVSITILFICAIGYFFGNVLLSLFGSINLAITSLIITTTVCISLMLGIDMYKRYQAKMKALNYN